MIRSDHIPRHQRRQVFALALALCMPIVAVPAQGLLARAAQRVASVTAELALSRAVAIDLTATGPAPVAHGALQVGVSSVDVVNGSVVRLHLFLHNAADTAVTQALPADTAFVLLDGTGRRFTLASVRSRTARAGSAMTVPALERAAVDVVFLLNNSTATEAVLKVGAGTVLRGIPIRTDATPAAPPVAAAAPAPVAAPALPPTPPDSTIPPT